MKFDEKDFVWKIIKDIYVDGYHFTFLTTDGVIFNYDASDGGYSSWEVKKDGCENYG